MNKKGYSRTEAMLRQEMASIDTQARRPYQRVEERGGQKYSHAYGESPSAGKTDAMGTANRHPLPALLSQWIEESLEIYKVELKRLLWPVFVYSLIGLIGDFYPDLCRRFYEEHNASFTRDHADDLRALEPLRHPEHLEESQTAQIYMKNKYRLTFTKTTFYILTQFLESKDGEGGSVILSIITTSMQIITTDRASGGAERSFAAMLAKGESTADMPDEDEGIPGHNPGSANTARDAPNVLTKLYLGPRPMDGEMAADVRDELEEQDAAKPPRAGESSLVEELDQKVKREPSEDAPDPTQVPLPKPLARDVAMEVQKVREHRDRFKLEPRSSGVGPGVSITMYTFHNTFDSINCLDFSGDNELVAAGTAESYIRVWSLDGNPLPSIVPNPSHPPTASRRLVGHSGPVYAVSFAPATSNDGPASASTRCRYLLSCSADKTVRLWSLDTWSCLVVYKGHDHPVWDVTWGPFGHYFVTGGHDHTARLWSTDHIAPLRIFAGHDKDVDCVAFHPNNAYVFSGSSDRTVRTWDCSRGTAGRLYTGHTGNITAIACAPNGRLLASADDTGAIIMWDLGNGRRLKRMRGHGKGGIWSLSFSAESSLLVSAGMDATVRVWDALTQTEAGGTVVSAKPGADGAGKAEAGGVSGVAGPGGKKLKAKDATVTVDQISAFPTKKSPVYKVRFTNMNLVLAGGAYTP